MSDETEVVRDIEAMLGRWDQKWGDEAHMTNRELAEAIVRRVKAHPPEEKHRE